LLIREVMHPNPIFISPETTLTDAYDLMNKISVRHLPILENEKLVGVVTDRDLRLATSKLAQQIFDPMAKVSEIMNYPVQTTHPSEPIEVATQIMRELKIGCLPVLENSKLVGIVTGVDILDAMLLLTGVHTPSSRLDVRLKDRKGEIARLTKIIADRNVSIHSILSYQEKNEKLRVVLRISTIDIRSLAKEICSSDFEVLWPAQISCAE
jgi:acetoin utilization protein AcuB